MKYRKILPLFYDALTGYPFTNNDLDALTWYEMLRIIYGKINEIINYMNGEVPEEAQRWFYVPEDFGAVGNGVTDDTSAFNDAARAMISGDIRILFIPANKNYLIKNTIAFPEGSSVLGAGETSRIYYDETSTGFGAGFTTGGDNVIFSNFRLDIATKSPILVTGSMAGAIAVSCVDHAGEMLSPVSQYARVPRKNVIVSRIWTDGRYALQTENPDTDRIIENVFVSDIFAPEGVVSIGSKGCRNIHYKNIYCEMLRTGSVDTQECYNVTVEDFSCNFIRAYSHGVKLANGLVDCSSALPVPIVYSLQSMTAPYNAIDLSDGNILDNVRFIAGNEDITTCIRANSSEDTERRIEFYNCDFGEFETFWTNADKITYADFYGCTGSQTGSHLAVISGGVYGGDMSGAVSSVRSPLSFVNEAKSTPDLSFAGTAIFSPKVSLQNNRLYVKYAGSLPADGVLASISADTTARFIANAIGDALGVILYNSSTGVMLPATASFAVSGSGTERTAALTIDGSPDLSGYDSYYIDSSVAIGTISD